MSRSPAHRYNPVPRTEEDAEGTDTRASRSVPCGHHTRLIVMFGALGLFSLVLLLSIALKSSLWTRKTCDGISKGYQCRPEMSHFWGQYSLYFIVPSEITTDTPSQCNITFVQTLARHGARDPTLSKSIIYGALIQRLKEDVKEFLGPYSFMTDYEYTLGADQLTELGQWQMVNSGLDFYNRYMRLSKDFVPFVRASGQTRVVESAQNFTQGFHKARLEDKAASSPDNFPYPIVNISEVLGSNNSLNHGLCKNFEDGPVSKTSRDAQQAWIDVFVPPIMARLNRDLSGANLTDSEVIYLMDLCPFNTVASSTGQISPFCDLFTEEEWHQYDYFESVGKYYGYSHGNPLGPSQGVGFTNELIARMTKMPVEDHTSVNHTLDGSNTTFPLGIGRPLYADFSHDNDITAIFSALGLYNSTDPLSKTSLQTTSQTAGYSASWTVPFAARAFFEKMKCEGRDEDLVRVLVNGRVLPLKTCGGDELGRCTLSKFVESLSFARGGGHWDQCFT